MNLGENMAFAPILARTSKEEVAERVNRAAEMLELTPYPDLEPGNVPGKDTRALHVEQKQSLLVEAHYGSDRNWVTEGRLAGLPNRRYRHAPSRGLGMTRGHQWPVPSANPGRLMNFFPETSEDAG